MKILHLHFLILVCSKFPVASDHELARWFLHLPITKRQKRLQQSRCFQLLQAVKCCSDDVVLPIRTFLTIVIKNFNPETNLLKINLERILFLTLS